MLVTTWATLILTVCPFNSSALSSEENKRSLFLMCFEKGRACFFLKFWEIKTCFTKKGERLTSNKGMVTYRYSYWEAVQSKNFPLVKHRKEKSAKSTADCCARPALVSLPTGQPSPFSLLSMEADMALSGQYLYFASDIFQRVNLLCLRRYYLMAQG